MKRILPILVTLAVVAAEEAIRYWMRRKGMQTDETAIHEIE